MALSDNPAFQNQVDTADNAIVASLTSAGLTARFEFTIVYVTTDIGGVVTVNRTFRGLTTTTDTGVQDVSA